MAAIGERFDPRRLAGQAIDLVLGRHGDPQAVSTPPSEKPTTTIVLTELSEAFGHKFDIENFESVRQLRIMKPWFGPVSDLPLDGKYAEMTPEQMALEFPSSAADGYFTFTKVSGRLIIDGNGKTTGGWGRGEPFSLEVQYSPRTYFVGDLGGRVVNYRDLVNDKVWGKAANKGIEKGLEQGVLFELTAYRPYDAGLYALRPGDQVITRPLKSYNRVWPEPS